MDFHRIEFPNGQVDKPSGEVAEKLALQALGDSFRFARDPPGIQTTGIPAIRRMDRSMSE
jgi:hypothetical protein